MLLAIGSPANVPAYIAAVKRREKVLSGFGHRYSFIIFYVRTKLVSDT